MIIKPKQDIIETIWKDYLIEKTDKDYTSLYIHFPYCVQKCNYCMHLSSEIKDLSIIDSKLDNLEKQFIHAKNIFQNEPIRTVYFGGGSPSLLNELQLERVLNMIQKHWNIVEDDKGMFSYELHPSQITDKKIEILKDSFINRVSMGIQSFDKKVLESENRIYIPKEKILETYEKLRKVFKRINVDFMYSLTNQTEESFINDIKTMVDRDAIKITMYGYNNLTGNRQIEDEDYYKKIFQRAMVLIHNEFTTKGYRFEGSDAKNYYEWNILIKDNANLAFDYFYDPTPYSFSNCLAFNIGENDSPISYFIPLNILYRYDPHGNLDMRSIFEFKGYDLWELITKNRINVLSGEKDKTKTYWRF
ncbi:MAG: radical SAM protein [bacterium]